MRVSFWIYLDQFNGIKANFKSGETIQITAWNHSLVAPLTHTVIRCTVPAENIISMRQGEQPGELNIKFRMS